MTAATWLDKRIQKMGRTTEQLLPKLRERFWGASMEIPDDLDVLNTRLVFEDGKNDLAYMMFHVRETEGGQTYETYRAVRILMLWQVPFDVRGDSGSLAKMRTVLRGLYSSSCELVYLIAGIYHPREYGIVQCYCTVGQGSSEEEAADQAMRHGAALEATLAAAYPQIKLKPVSSEIAEWMMEAMLNMPHGLIAIGHPDPRENARGGLSDITSSFSSPGEGRQQYTLQQNEIVMRGMAQLKEDFLLQVLLSPVDMGAAARMLIGMSEYTSSMASWQTGVRSFNIGTSVPMLLSGIASHSAGSGYTQSQGHNISDGAVNAHSHSHAVGQSDGHTEGHAITNGSSHVISSGQSITKSQGTVHGQSQSITDGQSFSHTQTQGSNAFSSDSKQGGVNINVIPGVVGIQGGGASSQGGGSSQFIANGQAQSHSVSQGVMSSQSEGQSITQNQSESVASQHSVTNSVSDTHTESISDTVGQSQSATHSEGQSDGSAVSRGLSRGLSNGLAIGLAPSVSMGESNQWQNDPAILITEILRTQQQLLNTITVEGGFYTDVYALARTARGHQALMALLPEAFHGVEDVVTGVQTRALTPEEEGYLRLHARVMVPSTREIRLPEAVTAYADSTLLTVLQSAAYMAPGLFEEGIAYTVQEAIPPFATDPNMRGNIVLGKQYSTERGELTKIPVRIAKERHFHSAFIGDSGTGKTVAAETLAHQVTLKHHMRTVVADFGAGWRKALNWPGLAGRVDIRQLYPGAVRPIRWNPMRVPKRIAPTRYRSLVTELFANAGQMGPRQEGFMAETLTAVYLNTGVLVDDSRIERQWQFVRDEDEERTINAYRCELGLPERPTRSMHLDDLETFERRALASHRSVMVDIADWLEHLRARMKSAEKSRDYSSVSSLQGALLRLQKLTEGEMRRMYAPGYDALEVENLGLLGSPDDSWGVTVIEGGGEMDEYSKSALLSLLVSILYLDVVARRRESLDGVKFPPLQIIFEEANKLLSGVPVNGGSDNNRGTSGQVPWVMQWMLRDGRKYNVWAYLLLQSPAEAAPGLLSSCGNIFIGQTKDSKDRGEVLSLLARTNKGFVDTKYDRFIARMPTAMTIAKFGHTMKLAETEPILMRANLLDVHEPSDMEIYRHFHRLG